MSAPARSNRLRERQQRTLVVVLLGLLALTLTPGLASAGAISVSPSLHDFGRVNVGASSATFPFTVTNTGGGSLTISSLNHSNPAAGFTASAPSSPITTIAAISTAFLPTGSGPFSDNVTIESDATNGSVSFLLTGIANNAPVFTPALAANYSLAVSVPFILTVTATDPEGDPIVYSVQGKPPLANFDKTTGTFTWTPSCSDVGSYPLTFSASDGLAQTSASATFTVTLANAIPTSNPDGPYTGCAGAPVNFNGSGSSSPCGPLTYSWNFGDNSTGTGVTPAHAYANGGTYNVCLTVNDGNQTATTCTVATISPACPALISRCPSNQAFSIHAAQQCLYIQPIGSCFALSDVVPGSIVLRFGSNTTPATGASLVGDNCPSDGVQDMQVCFSKANMLALLSSTVPPAQMLTLTIEGSLINGCKFSGSITLQVVP